jgi:exonuclease VII large subunit
MADDEEAMLQAQLEQLKQYQAQLMAEGHFQEEFQAPSPEDINHY